MRRLIPLGLAWGNMILDYARARELRAIEMVSDDMRVAVIHESAEAPSKFQVTYFEQFIGAVADRSDSGAADLALDAYHSGFHRVIPDIMQKLQWSFV